MFWRDVKESKSDNMREAMLMFNSTGAPAAEESTLYVCVCVFYLLLHPAFVSSLESCSQMVLQ